jgi:hypothetical protein
LLGTTPCMASWDQQVTNLWCSSLPIHPCTVTSPVGGGGQGGGWGVHSGEIQMSLSSRWRDWGSRRIAPGYILQN